MKKKLFSSARRDFLAPVELSEELREKVSATISFTAGAFIVMCNSVNFGFGCRKFKLVENWAS